MSSKYKTREEWLNKAETKLRPLFKQAGFNIPPNIRVSCGWPSARGTSSKNKTIGQCWSSNNSGDGTFEIFISPVLEDSCRVLDVLAHELVHATVGLECGHKGDFRRCAVGIGLTGKMTATTASEELKAKLGEIVSVIGEYPHAQLSASSLKKQSTRLIKAECNGCGMVIRTTQKWIDETGLPECACGGHFE